MKIVHLLLGKAKPDSLSGLNKVVHFLATEQVRSGHDVEVWGLSKSSRAADNDRVYSFRVFPMTRARFQLHPELRQALDGVAPDSRVHMHGAFTPEFVTISRELVRRGIRYGVSPHGAFVPGSLERHLLRKKSFIWLFDRRMLSQADVIHAVCVEEANAIRRIAPGSRVVVVPNGQDLKFLEGFVRVAADTERPVFGFCGRLDTFTKGIDLLLQGFARYKRGAGRGVLWLVGDGEDRKNLEQTARSLGIADHVQFLGARYGADKLQNLANMDLFVLTSRRDVMPTSCLEAAAIGKPLLVSKETNLGDYIGSFDCGIVLRNNRPDEIADAFKVFEAKFFANELSRFARNSRAMIENELNWERVAARWTKEAYPEVCTP